MLSECIGSFTSMGIRKRAVMVMSIYVLRLINAPKQEVPCTARLCAYYFLVRNSLKLLKIIFRRVVRK